MADWVLETTDREIDEALERAQAAPAELIIASARYHSGLRVLELVLSNGRRLVFPKEDLQALAHATEEQASHFEIGEHGTDIWWPEVDEGHYLPNLLEGRTGSKVWMERRAVAA